jgi:ABC-type amino acid transport substrate-binding protein
MKRGTAVLLSLFMTVVALITAGCRMTQKTLVVGTSMDWEPFEFITEDGSYAGFDIELMEEIGRRLNMTIEWRDLAFDTLISSLVNDDLDAVMAALNPTPARRAAVDFTEPYYVSVDAILVAADSAITIDALQDLEGYRIGVLPETVQEAWIEATIRANVQRYDRAEQAIAALRNGEIDIVVINYYSARGYLDQGGVTLALRSEGSGDTMAIAVRRGNSKLRDRLNKVISDLQSEGFIEDLAMRYLSGE